MEPTTTGVATASLAILQAYPLGTLRVEVKHKVPTTVHSCRLDGIDMSQDKPVKVAHQTKNGFTLGFGYYSPEEVTPYLKDFRALTQQLPDGTVPAVEVAKLVGGGHEWCVSLWGKGYVVLETMHCGYICTIKDLMSNGDKGWGWEIAVRTMVMRELQEGINTCAAYDYLRAKHFAVGLPETAYIPL